MWLAFTLGLLAVGAGLFVHRFGARTARDPSTPLTAVILGARVHPDGTPSPALVDRVRRGVELVQRGQARRLLLSGGTPDTRPTEAAAMATLALSLGARPEHLALEPQSRSTFENAARCAEWLAREGETEVLLVTCDFHLARATAHFRAHQLTVWPHASRRSLTAADRLMVTAREVIALLRRPWLLLRLRRRRPARPVG